MPLYPPPMPVQHPADLVIDVFGTFLGKRSEQLVIRWREQQPSQSQPEQPANGLSEDLRPLMTPEELVQPGQSSQESEINTPAHDAMATHVSSGEQAAEITPSSADHPVTGNSSASQECAAEQAAAQLLNLWAAQSPPLERPLPLSGYRLQEQLSHLADHPAGTASNGSWRERAVPISRLRSVTVSGRGITVSSDVIAALVERGIGLSFLTGRGQPVAQLISPGLGGTVQTRRKQLAAYETSLGVKLAVEFIRGKLRNQKHQLQYSAKYLKATDPLRFERVEKKIKTLAALRKQLTDFQAENLDDVRDKLMGYEGTAARIYWEGVAILLEGRVEFPGRITRGAIDPVNSALNYGYGILYSQVAGAISNAGLELYAGFLHVDRPGKPALVLDLVEEFRAPIVDRSILAIANQGILLETDTHGLTGATRKLIAHRVLERLNTPVPYEGKRWSLGTIIQNQARHLAVAVRGEREYRAFASRW